jgi:hypothetical protein
LSQELVDLELFKNAVEDWAIEEKFSTRLHKVATDFCVMKRAAEDSCPFSSAVHRIRRVSSLSSSFTLSTPVWVLSVLLGA